MRQFLQWLLDLENIHLGRDAPLLLRWNHEVEAWILFVFGLAALTWITLIYRREQVSPGRFPRGRRLMLMLVRCGILALTVAVICQPSLILQRNRIEPSHVTLVLDTSLSMGAKESYGDQSLAQSIAQGAGLEDPGMIRTHSRLQLIKNALLSSDAAPLRRLLERNGVMLYTFAGQVETKGFFAIHEEPDELGAAVEVADPLGASTDLAGAIHQVLARTQGRRLAAIVLATDGQTTQPSNLKDALDQARDRKIPIFPLRIGSTQRPRDLRIESVRAQESVFANDVLAVEVQLAATGLIAPVWVTVQLIDEKTQDTVASQKVVIGPPDESTLVELRVKPTSAGLVRYRAEVSPLPNETSTLNNSERVDITILDNRLHILYVESYPRYEYRYMKNAMLREQTLELSVLLIEADERFVQEGSDPIRRFPETPEELSRYDVVVFGDVDPRSGWLTRAQMNMLLDFVANEGGGFGLIAGERAAPHRFLGTPLEKLIPVRIDPTFFGHYDRVLTTGYRPQLTLEGKRSRVFRFAADRVQSERLFDALPELYWIARTLGEKPGASVLAEHPTLKTVSGPLPVMVTGRYGAGKLFFQATDDTWRWRRHTGELLHDTYWVQVARELVGSGKVSQDSRFVLRTDQRVYPYGSPVRAGLEIFDVRLLANQGDTIEILITTPESNSGESTIDPRDGGIVGRFDLHRIGTESNRYEGTWVPPGPGRFVLALAEIAPYPGEQVASLRVRIDRPDLETRRPEANHQVLERIANSTGGQVVDLDELETAFAAIRNRSIQIPDDVVEPLWDSKLVLMLFAVMISMEWVLRKRFGLL